MGADGFEAGPTDAGEYRIAYVGKHKSARYPAWSSVRWGAPLRKERGVLQVQVDGTWQNLSKFTTVTEADVVEQYERLYGVRRLPNAWVFNDFGHLTVYMYKDLDSDGKFDKGTEKIHGEFMHTTPIDEARTALGRPVVLSESHGCLHIKPDDIDDMVRKGYLRKNNRVAVHGYHERVIRFTFGMGKPPYELHVYPGIKTMCIVGHAK
jgi:hypothetical protein